MTSSPDQGAPILVVGAGGLLGSAVVRAARAGGVVVRSATVPWGDVTGSVEALATAVDTLLDEADGGPWQLAWCAGAGVTATAAEQIADEVETLRRFVDHLLDRAATALPAGRVFLASSAGALYAGATGAPFDESVAPAPLSAYGHGKLRAEAEMARLATAG